MFLPLAIEHSYERRPFVTWAIFGTCVLVAILLGFDVPDDVAERWGTNPRDFAFWQFVTSTFLHAGPFHLAGNMLFLWVFGRYVEDRLGWWRYALLYFLASATGDVAYLVAGARDPAVGASGAIAGLMGWVLVAAPWVQTRFMLLVWNLASRPFEIAAGWLIVPWIGFEVLMASDSDVLGVAGFAHVGGFALGAGVAAVMRGRWTEGTSWHIDRRRPEGGKEAVDRLRQARAHGIGTR